MTRRERLILYAVVMIVVLSLIYNFLFEPLIQRWNKINQEINLIKARIQKSLSVVKEKDRIDKEYATHAERLRPKASDEQEMTNILNGIEKLARNSNLKIVNIKPKPPQGKAFYKWFVVGLETESNMKSLMKFIYDVKNSPQLLRVDRLNLNTKSSQAGAVIRASMVISKISMR